MVVTPMPSRVRTASLILGQGDGIAAAALLNLPSFKLLLPRLWYLQASPTNGSIAVAALGGVRALTLDRASPTSAADVMPWLDLACVAIQSFYYLARIGLTVKDPVGGLDLCWQSIPFVLPEPLVSPKHVDEELWSRTCPYYLAEVAQFNWLSLVDWMAGVAPEEVLALARAKSGHWLQLLHDEVLSRLKALGWDKADRVAGSQEVPNDLHQGRLWHQLACLRYLQQMLSSARDPTDDAWVTKAVQEAMMHWHSSESRRVIQEVFMPGGDPDSFPESNRHWKGGQVKHFRIALPDAMSVAARRAFIWGVPVSDASGSFGFQLVGWKAALEGLVTDTAPVAPSLGKRGCWRTHLPSRRCRMSVAGVGASTGPSPCCGGHIRLGAECTTT
eukprot:5962333-Pleurochrysis_carterae.AAC.1